MLAILMPTMGSCIDGTSYRKKFLKVVITLCSVFTMAQSIMGFGYLWVVSLVFFGIVALTYELQFLSQSAYLPEITKNQGERVYLGSCRQFLSFGAQLLFLIIFIALSVAFPSSPLPRGSSETNAYNVSRVSCILCGIWILSIVCYAIRYLPDSVQTKDSGGNGSRCGRAFQSLGREICMMKKDHPETFKLMFVKLFASMGVSAILEVSSTFFVEQIGVTSLQNSIIT